MKFYGIEIKIAEPGVLPEGIVAVLVPSRKETVAEPYRPQEFAIIRNAPRQTPEPK